MEPVNGDVPALQDTGSNLGKRKRSASPEKKIAVNGHAGNSIQHDHERVLDQVKGSESVLSREDADRPEAKRVRRASDTKDESSSGADSKSKESEDSPDQILILRSSTDKGVATLYSGLQTAAGTEAARKPIDGRSLPNGFDLARPAKIDPAFLAAPKQPRKFADVFGPHRNTKALEMPKGRPAVRSNVLGFSAEAFPERIAPLNRQDYRHQQLATATWVDYSRGHTLDELDASRKYRDKGVAANDFRAALIANDHSVNESNNNIALYKQAFSSFAPTTDSSLSLVNNEDRSRIWWRKQGSKQMKKIFTASYPDLDEPEPVKEQSAEDDFEGVLSYEPSTEELQLPERDDPTDIDDVLEEISELLETVHSYQRIRSLETRQSTDPSKPSGPEFDAFDVLRSQLAILVAAVPPFAVSKLDGDKLSDLNISTNIKVDSVDYKGTMQADDFTLAKYRSAQQAAAARLPQAVSHTPVARTTYGTQQQSTAAQFNSNLQAYAANLGIQAQHAQRQAQVYATPSSLQHRPSYASYQQSGSVTQGTTHAAQPTVQQFQRPPTATPANGYNGSWNTTKSAATGTPTPAGIQTPSQPGYAQRAAQKLQQQQQQTWYGGSQAYPTAGPVQQQQQHQLNGTNPGAMNASFPQFHPQRQYGAAQSYDQQQQPQQQQVQQR
ncbi:uncharacterized protein AB675_3812 [Cyphellophora attinorum]|uniref:DUF7785 domain-containing protein n=1 Tax=Cyphellophora attinorum TaxID=1664694 RepID=A0A0N1H1U0_9EURO|nr:uncharacterized protein AB675_3812 [Phialophora attinorum]KPI34924.1 hypothetical protein AB675_3812 [Phialophora attinorum]